MTAHLANHLANFPRESYLWRDGVIWRVGDGKVLRNVNDKLTISPRCPHLANSPTTPRARGGLAR